MATQNSISNNLKTATADQVTFEQTGLKIKGGDTKTLTLKLNETVAADRVLNLKVGAGDRTLQLDADLTVSATATVSGTNTGDISAANPTGTIGLTASNGVATTWMRSDATPALGVTIAPTWTGIHTFDAPGIATTSTDAVAIINSTASTSGTTQQNSPRLRFKGQSWASSANHTYDIWAQIEGETSSTRASLVFYQSIDGAAATRFISFRTDGLVGLGTGLTHYISTGGVVTTSSMSAGTTITTTRNSSSAIDGFIGTTGTSATGGSPQIYAPRVRLTGAAWTGSASQAWDWTIDCIPGNGTNPITSTLTLNSQINAGGYNTRFSLKSDGNITLTDGSSINTGTSTGVKFGSTTSDKIGFWNTSPIVQPTTGVAAATFTANSGTAVNDASTFDGYTLNQVVKALRNVGLLA